jgi:TatD DNase family protein
MLVDSHCHLDFLKGNLDTILDEAKKHGVEYILSICTNLKNFPKIIEIAKNYDNVYATVGLHPGEQVKNEPTIDELVKLADDPKVVAFGETGLDYYHNLISPEKQLERFRIHIDAADKINKPLIVHNRDASEDTVKALQDYGADKVGGVMHCFSGTLRIAQQAMEMNFYISFSGIVTFKNADKLREIAKLVPLDKILLETDAPYLAPDPYRGKPNQPAYVTYVAKCIAEIKNIPYETVARQTTNNFMRLFL